MNTPVAFLVFNRPNLTRRVFEAIRDAQPPKLLIVADGPRRDHPDDLPKCAQVRSIVAEVDWPCEILTNYSETNLGCKRRVSSGLNWVFDRVEEVIILEDDCLPEPSFFQYCEELLERYRDDTRVFHISGNSFRFAGEKNAYSYFFSRYSFIWGWASWRRAWKHYDVEMTLWPTIRDENWLSTFLGDATETARFTQEFEAIYTGGVDTWDYQWGLACWINHGLTIRPNVNLVSNIGFGDDATHTTAVSSTANLPTDAMSFPLRHPPFMMRNSYEDKFLHSDRQPRAAWSRIQSKITRFLFPSFTCKGLL